MNRPYGLFVGGIHECPEKKEIFMDNYNEMYFILFNAITDAIKILQEAQQKVEEIYMSSKS